MKNWKTMTSWLVTLAAMAIMLSILPSCDTPENRRPKRKGRNNRSSKLRPALRRHDQKDKNEHWHIG